MGTVNFGASARSASVVTQGKIKPHRPSVEGVARNFAANVLLRPSWLKAEHEDAYLLGMCLKLYTNGPVTYTRTQLCEKIFGRSVVSEDEDKKLNRAMWELHRLGIVHLQNLEVT